MILLQNATLIATHTRNNTTNTTVLNICAFGAAMYYHNENNF